MLSGLHSPGRSGWCSRLRRPASRVPIRRCRDMRIPMTLRRTTVPAKNFEEKLRSRRRVVQFPRCGHQRMHSFPKLPHPRSPPPARATCPEFLTACRIELKIILSGGRVNLKRRAERPRGHGREEPHTQSQFPPRPTRRLFVRRRSCSLSPSSVLLEKLGMTSLRLPILGCDGCFDRRRP